jgi:hypothetical protein
MEDGVSYSSGAILTLFLRAVHLHAERNVEHSRNDEGDLR